MNQVLLLIFCILLFTTGDYFAAKWGYERNNISLVLALVIGPFAYVVFGYLAAAGSLGRMCAFVNSGIVICAALAGIIFLGERPDRMTLVALGVIVLGLTLLSMGNVESGGA